MGILIAVLKLLPVLIEVVRVLEVAIPIAGQGKAKLDLVLGIVETVYGVSNDLTKELPQSKTTPLIVSIVGKIVGTFNALGVFKKEVQA